MPQYRISHITSFHYSFPVAVSHHSAYLRPKDNHDQTCHRFNLRIDPRSDDVIERTDFFGNTTQIFSVQEHHPVLHVESKSLVTVERAKLDLESLQITYGESKNRIHSKSYNEREDEIQFLYPTALTPDAIEIENFGSRFFNENTPIGQALREMLQAFESEFEFDATATDVDTPVLEVIKNRRGVCQDFAHLMIAAIRACGLPAKYCSGYILTHPPEGQERLKGADASHAWVSVYIPEHGWVDVDPTNNTTCSDEYVIVAHGRDYSDVTMLKGAVSGGGDHTVSVGVTVLPIDPTTPVSGHATQ